MKKLLLFLTIFFIFTSCKKEVDMCKDCSEGFYIVVTTINSNITPSNFDTIYHYNGVDGPCVLNDWLLHYRDTLQQYEYNYYDYSEPNVWFIRPDDISDKTKNSGECRFIDSYLNGKRDLKTQKYPHK